METVIYVPLLIGATFSSVGTLLLYLAIKEEKNKSETVLSPLPSDTFTEIEDDSKKSNDDSDVFEDGEINQEQHKGSQSVEPTRSIGLEIPCDKEFIEFDDFETKLQRVEARPDVEENEELGLSLPETTPEIHEGYIPNIAVEHDEAKVDEAMDEADDEEEKILEEPEEEVDEFALRLRELQRKHEAELESDLENEKSPLSPEIKEDLEEVTSDSESPIETENEDTIDEGDEILKKLKKYQDSFKEE